MKTVQSLEQTVIGEDNIDMFLDFMCKINWTNNITRNTEEDYEEIQSTSCFTYGLQIITSPDKHPT